MKVKKFIQLFESSSEKWNKMKVIELFKQEEEIKKKKDKIENLLHEFFMNNLQYLTGDLKSAFENDLESFNSGEKGFYVSYSVWVQFIYDKTLKINFSWDDGDESETYEVGDEDGVLGEIFEFINNPEMYRNAKKYNL